MATITTAVAGDQRVIFHDVPWEIYLGLLNARREGAVRLTYHRGVLEIMTISQLHERLSRLLHNFVKVLSKEYGFEVASVGSTTMHGEQRPTGAEADESYYIGHEAIVREREEYDPAVDPPPDLAVEIDLSSGSSRRMLVYAELGIPELWQYDGERLMFKSLGDDGQYHSIEQSIAFPRLVSADLAGFMRRRGTIGENALEEELRQWIRTSLETTDQ